MIQASQAAEIAYKAANIEPRIASCKMEAESLIRQAAAKGYRHVDLAQESTFWTCFISLPSQSQQGIMNFLRQNGYCVTQQQLRNTLCWGGPTRDTFEVSW